jgi:cell division protein ZapB
MLSSRPEKPSRKRGVIVTELSEINQLGLDFTPAPSYSAPFRKDTVIMNQELIETLEKKIGELVEKYISLKEENELLHDEVKRLSSDREGIKSRVDALLGKLDGI